MSKKHLYNAETRTHGMRTAVLVMLLLVLSGCAGGFPGRAPTKEQQSFIPEFRIGTQGLVMRFATSLPPPRIFSGEDLPIVLELENKGTTTIGGPGDRIYLTGFDPGIIAGISPAGEQIPLLEGRTQFVNQGGFDTLSFKAQTRFLKDRYPVRMLATACYEYETVASANVCIDPNPYSPAIRQKVCSPTNVPLGGGQGAPIAVNLVETDASPGKTRFKVHIQNVGGGEVFRAGGISLNHCAPTGPGLGFDEIDYAELADVIVSERSIRSSCRPLDAGHVRFTNGQALVYCEYERPSGEAAYMTPLTIVIRYGYRQSLFRNVEILPST